MAEDKELAAMTVIARALDGFSDEDAAVRERILNWACSRYQVAGKTTKSSAGKGDQEEHDDQGSGGSPTVDSFADLFHEADPESDVDRALIAGYWLGKGAAREEFTAADANKELKNLGHPLAHITDALQALIDRRPALAMQTAKSGTARQARKKYKLTVAGTRAVDEMVKATT